MYKNDFRDLVLLDPIRKGAESLKIISGYATHTMASWHIKEIAWRKLDPIDIVLIVGMCCFDGISKAVHEGFNSLVQRNGTSRRSNFACQYVVDGAPVHSKIYLWEKGGVPFCAFMGSANYTQSAFSISSQRRELLQECNPADALAYFESIEPDTMYCYHAEVEEKINLKPTHPILSIEDTPLVSLQGIDVENIRLSLLTNRGDVGYGSGINWGHRRNGTKREPNQMYIKIPASVKQSGFFPLRGEHFSVLTDDGIHLILSVQQDGEKAITTPHSNSRLGEYFRRRMGLGNGVFVTKQDLENYGRTDVTFYKLDDEQYVMDFSV
jgi:hypothetical protein